MNCRRFMRSPVKGDDQTLPHRVENCVVRHSDIRAADICLGSIALLPAEAAPVCISAVPRKPT
jgi:hypothetical protein